MLLYDFKRLIVERPRLYLSILECQMPEYFFENWCKH